MRKLNKFQNFVFLCGGLLIVIGAATYITGWNLSFYLFALGACCFSSMQILAGYEGTNLVVKRLRRQQVIGAIFILLAAAAMAMNTFRIGFAQQNEWVLCLTIASVVELYTAFRIPSELEKE